MKRWTSDVVALGGVAGGAAVGGLATLALLGLGPWQGRPCASDWTRVTQDFTIVQQTRPEKASYTVVTTETPAGKRGFTVIRPETPSQGASFAVIRRNLSTDGSKQVTVRVGRAPCADTEVAMELPEVVTTLRPYDFEVSKFVPAAKYQMALERYEEAIERYEGSVHRFEPVKWADPVGIISVQNEAKSEPRELSGEHFKEQMQELGALLGEELAREMQRLEAELAEVAGRVRGGADDGR